MLFDTGGPLTSLMEQGKKGCLIPKAAAGAATQALWLLGYANAAISHKRRRRVADCLKRELYPLLAEEDRFRAAVPYLLRRV